jgi:phage terminase Nu1 subunit (DNA packaging protein)
MGAYMERREAHETKIKDKKHDVAEKIRKREYQNFVKETLPLDNEGTGREKLRRVASKWAAEKEAVVTIAAENRAVM